MRPLRDGEINPDLLAVQVGVAHGFLGVPGVVNREVIDEGEPPVKSIEKELRQTC